MMTVGIGVEGRKVLEGKDGTVSHQLPAAIRRPRGACRDSIYEI